MPAVQLCDHCKQVIDTQKEQYVVLAPQASRAAEVIAHVTCEQDRVKKKAVGGQVRLHI
jgi:hypothetical protein